MSSWIFLSYPLNSKAFGYGNGSRFKLNQIRSIANGDTSNNTSFEMPTHFGTHIDFPFHFCVNGPKATDYSAQHFVFNQVALIEVNPLHVTDYLIKGIDLSGVEKFSTDINFLIIKTGFCTKRYTNQYWEFGLGFHKETAQFLKTQFPQLRAIGFDLISLNSYQQREHGREAHKAFLCEHNVLIVEEMDLNNVNSATKFKQVIVSPLMIENGDGAPVTILAEIIEG